MEKVVNLCGICGIIITDHNCTNFSIGSLLYQMMEIQQVRAQDSSGVAIFNDRKIYDNSNSYNIAYIKKTLTNDEYVMGEENIRQIDNLYETISSLRKDKEISIIGSKKYMKLIKDSGLVKDLEKKYKIKSMKGSHGIGHLRIATSSKADPSNAHPFSTTILSDLAIVHNGEISNYSKLRNLLEMKGYTFYSYCDSEVIAIFLADQILEHGNIEKAHEAFIRNADGPFTYIAATDNSLSLVRDKFGTRKGIIGYNPGDETQPAFWAMATDLSALNIVGAKEKVKSSPPGKCSIFTIQ